MSLSSKLRETKDSEKNHQANIAWEKAIDKYDSTKGELVYEYGFRSGFDSGFDCCYQTVLHEIHELVEALDYHVGHCGNGFHDEELLEKRKNLLGEK